MRFAITILISLIIFGCAHCPVNPNGGGGGGSCGGVNFGGVELESGKLIKQSALAMKDVVMQDFNHSKAGKICKFSNRSFTKNLTLIVKETVIRLPLLSSEQNLITIEDIQPRSVKQLNYKYNYLLFNSEIVDYEIISAVYNN